MESRKPSERLAEIAKALVDGEECLRHVRCSRASIAYLESDREKTSRGKTVFAECERVPDKYRWAIPNDFTITVFMPNVERFDDEQMRILMLHELMHIGVEVDGNEETYRVVPHDVEDFEEIIERHGIGWHRRRG